MVGGRRCRLVPEVEIGHIYKDRFSYTVYPSQILYNYLFVARCSSHLIEV